MTIYQKVLIELGKDSSLKSQYNNLVKIMYSTEDNELIKRIKSWLNVLKQAESYRQRKLPSHVNDLLMASVLIKQNLKDYCEDVIMSGKPEWQVLAERNGWGPLL